MKGQGSGDRALEFLNINLSLLGQIARVAYIGLAVYNERLNLADVFSDDDISVMNNTDRTRLENRDIRKPVKIHARLFFLYE